MSRAAPQVFKEGAQKVAKGDARGAGLETREDGSFELHRMGENKKRREWNRWRQGDCSRVELKDSDMKTVNLKQLLLMHDSIAVVLC